MQKPANYDETNARCEFSPIELGGHKMVIKQVEERKSKSGKDMIVVYVDFAQDDVQPDYFSTMYMNDTREDKKWPYQGTQYIMVHDKDGKCSQGFKTFTTCVEHSNPGFETQWGDIFCAQFKGKRIGGVFGNVEDEYNGKVSMKRKMRWFVSVDKADDVPIPDEKLLQRQDNFSSHTGNNDFMDIPDGIDGGLPFN